MPVEDPQLKLASPRVPNLAVRTRSETEDRIEVVTAELTPPRKGSRLPVNSPQRTPALRPPTLAAVSPASPGTTIQEQKKKPNLIISFLTLKEPSQYAFEQYAQQQRKQAAAKGGRAAGSFMGISSQKLPPTIPKVNSKWDGLPTSTKDKEAIKKGNRQSTISTTSRPWKSHSNRSSHEPNTSASLHSVHGAPPSLAASNQRGNERPPLLPFSQTTPVEPPALSPVLANSAALTRPHSLQPQSTLTPRSPNSFTDVDVPKLPKDLPPRSSTPLNSPIDELPVTPPDISAIPPHIILATLATPPHLKTEQEFNDLPQWPLTSSPGDVIIKSSGPDVLGPPSTAKRRAKTNNQGFLAGEAQELQLPDDEAESPRSILKHKVPPISARSPLRAASPRQTDVGQAVPMHAPPPAPSFESARGKSAEVGVSSKFPYPDRATSALARSDSVPSGINVSGIERSDSTSCENSSTPVKPMRRRFSGETILSVAESTAPSIAPSLAGSAAPSELSAQWYKSPKERLGLGGNLRYSTAAPWETRDYMGDVGEIARELGRNGAVTPTPREGGKKKRFSIRRK